MAGEKLCIGFEPRDFLQAVAEAASAARGEVEDHLPGKIRIFKEGIEMPSASDRP